MRKAACIAVHVDGVDPRLLWVRRSESARFLPGFYAVPGGALDPVDDQMAADDTPERALRVAGLRELFEEVGFLAVHGEPSPEERRALRERFRQSAAAGAEAFRSLGLRWRTAALEPAGRWTAPEHASTRFDTWFFALRVDAPSPVEADPSELALAEWVTPTVAHARWQAASVRLGPPLAALLRAFLRGPALDVRAVRQAPGADGSPSLRYEVLPGIQCLPLRSPTLPPATHTNTFIVGTGEAVLVEPASPYPEEVDRAVAWVEENARAGVHVKAIVATHHHADHIGGAVALKERLGLPLWAHTRTRERLAGAVEVERELADGERLELGGTTPMELSAVLTPGHAPGHLCFRDGASGALLAGDMVAGVGTILIEPTDGDMGLYLESLRRMAASEPSVLLPAHGGPIDDVQGLLAHYVQHRLAREARVFEALADADGPVTAAELVPVAYADARPAVWPIATLAAEAHLLYLERQGRATRVEGGRWRPVRS